jgi:hypothetical protein
MDKQKTSEAFGVGECNGGSGGYTSHSDRARRKKEGAV